MIFDIQSATRQLVKQQITWFKKDGLYQLVDVSDDTFDVAEHILREYDKPKHHGVHAVLDNRKQERNRGLAYVPA